MRLPPTIVISAWVLAAGSGASFADERSADAKAVEFFEAKVRPVLVRHCYECHSAESETLQGGLRLDFAEGARKGGDSGAAVVPGSTDESLLISSLKYESFEMPPSGRLPDHVVRDFEIWIRSGAVDPRIEAGVAHEKPKSIDIEARRQFWAFQPPQPAPSLVQRESSTGASLDGSARIDALVDTRLQERGIVANGPADRRALLRRLSFDLTGLPPTDEDMAAFVSDPSADAVTRQVDALLSRPAYGERWARMWLDVARYAEDQAHIVGNNNSLFYPNAWKYRDWVIAALNQDMPFDDFITLQLAADQVAPDDKASHVALGFIGLGPKYYRRGDPEVMAEEWEDRVDVVSRGLLGVTVACARCHDHKYDPIRTEDYYGLAGVFASSQMFNRALTEDAERDKNGQAEKPEESMHIVRDTDVQDLAVMIRGNVHQRGDVVPRGFPAVLFEGPRREFQNGSGRAELAAAIVDRHNPLTARVIVNRVWQQYFGRGIVGTASNFGELGERPTHPELLDDLAVRFMDNGWSLKWLHRQIVLSQTYQRSSDRSADAWAADPENRWLWRMPRRRLSVEAWRDAVLSAAGRLSETVGGPSIRPDDLQATRRTVYSEVSRLDLHPLLARFDFPDPNVHAARRAETNTPLQKLFLLNSEFMIQSSSQVAERAANFEGTSTDQVQFVFRTALQREADAVELEVSEQFVAAHPDDGLQQLAQSLLISNEFWFLD